MDNQETMATLGTQDTGPTQIKHKIEHVQHRQLKKKSNTNLTTQPGVNQGAPKGQ